MDLLKLKPAIILANSAEAFLAYLNEIGSHSCCGGFEFKASEEELKKS